MIGYRRQWCGFKSIRERRQRGCWVRGRRPSAYGSVAGEASICREQMNIGGLDVVAVEANTGQRNSSVARVEESVRGCGFGLDRAFQSRRTSEPLVEDAGVERGVR